MPAQVNPQPENIEQEPHRSDMSDSLVKEEEASLKRLPWPGTMTISPEARHWSADSFDRP